MTNIEKIEKILDSEDLYISVHGLEITEIDFDSKEIFYDDGDTISFDEIESTEDSYFIVYGLDEKDFPEDIFELATLFKGMMKRIETNKEQVVLFIDENPITSLESLEEHTQSYMLEDNFGYMQFFYKTVKKNYLSKMKVI